MVLGLLRAPVLRPGGVRVITVAVPLLNSAAQFGQAGFGANYRPGAFKPPWDWFGYVSGVVPVLLKALGDWLPFPAEELRH